MTLTPTWLSCYTFGELTFNSLSKGWVRSFKREKSQQCLQVIHWLAVIQVCMGTVQGGKRPHKRPSENTAEKVHRAF